jgi:hypothetical protein
VKTARRAGHIWNQLRGWWAFRRFHQLNKDIEFHRLRDLAELVTVADLKCLFASRNRRRQRHAFHFTVGGIRSRLKDVHAER